MNTTAALERLVSRTESWTGLDGAVGPLNERVRAVLDARPTLTNAVSGTWLGHPLHPLLTDLPIGFWTSAMALDALAIARRHDGDDGLWRAARTLVGLGLLSTPATAAAGIADASYLGPDQARTGAVHGALNVLGAATMFASWRARRRGRPVAGAVLLAIGSVPLTVAGYLGGHLGFRNGSGVDHQLFDEAPDEWTVVEDGDHALESDVVGAGAMAAGTAAGAPVVIGRDTTGPGGGDAIGFARRCSHQGAPLDEGTLSDGCVTCPWHGSVFRIDDGSVTRGPATAPMQTLDVRRAGRRWEVRRRPAPPS